jgi:alkylated DNA repair dioxygenase AlkB
MAIFHYIPNYISNNELKDLFDYLEKTDNFISVPKYVDDISRYQKWYQVDKKYFCPNWKERYPQWESFQLDDTIKKLILDMQELLDKKNINAKLNSCLINKYPDGKHFISPHRDSSESFGKEPVIIILSLGETRTITFQNKDEQFSYDLESGSVFIMAGLSQELYLHSIGKSDSQNVRYSLTFREFIL